MVAGKLVAEHIARNYQASPEMFWLAIVLLIAALVLFWLSSDLNVAMICQSACTLLIGMDCNLICQKFAGGKL